MLDTAPIAVIAAIGLVTLPGALVAGALRLAGLWFIAAASAISIGLAGAAGVIGGWLDLPFAWWMPLALGAVVAGLIATGQSLLGRSWRWGRPLVGAWSVALVAPAVGMLLSIVAIVLTTVLAIENLSSISQTYDAVFHLNAVAYVLDTGDASSFTLYRVNHLDDGDIEFYPAAWHALVASVAQLTGVGVPLATNAMWLATSTMVWVPGVTLLAATVAPSLWNSTVVTTTAALLASTFAAFPYLLLDWGTLYPNGLAYGLLPLGVALVWWVVRRWASATSSQRIAIVALAAAWFVAASTSHPRSLPSFAVLAAPIVLAAVVAWWFRTWRRGRRRQLLVGTGLAVAGLVLAIAAAWAYVARTYGLEARPVSDRLNGGPATAHQGIAESAWQALANAPLSSPGEVPLAPSILLSLLVVLGVVIAFATPGLRPLAVAWVLVVVLYVLAAGTNADVAKILTGLWYKDKYRLMAMLPIVAVPLGAIAAAWVFERIANARLRTIAVASLVGLVVASSWLGGTLAGMRAAIGAVFSIQDEKLGRILDTDEFRLLERLDRLPESTIIAGNPWNGSALAWAISGQPVLFPHLDGEWSADAALVASSLDRALEDPQVCAAVGRLGLEYVLDDPEFLWDDPPEAQRYGGLSRAPAAGVLEEVDREGSAVLYRITACAGEGLR